MNAEEKFQFSELRYRRIFETAQDGILIVNADSGMIVDVNPFLTELFGYSKKQFIKKQIWQVDIFKDVIDSKDAFLEMQMKGHFHYRDLLLETKAGKPIYAELVSNTYLVGDEKVVQYNIRDVTNRKKAEGAITARTKQLEELTKSQEETKKAMLNVMEDLEKAKEMIGIEKAKDDAMLASIGEGLIAVDTEGRIIIMNTVAENILGLKVENILGNKITDLPLHDESGNVIPLEKRPATIALLTGKAVKITYYFERNDKRIFPMAITATPIKLGNKTLGLIEIIRDITRELEIDKAKSEFISLASHQLRTPLGIVKWYLEALQNEDYINNAPKNIAKYFDKIYRSNERVLSLVRDLLSVSRIDQGKVKNEPRLIDIVSAIKEIVEQIQIIAQKKRILVRLDFNKDKIPLINIDSLRFHQVVENLIDNAIEYSPDNSFVDVSIKKVKKNLVIGVKDSGIGISQSDQKNLFTKFFRSAKAVVHNPEGSGLGLYVVKSYVESWGGKIYTESIENKGSTFTISLPIS